jgi:hypothetical protein
MAISNFGELKTSLASLINRRDFATSIPDFIALFEAEFDADPRTAKHRRRICRSSSEISEEYEALPSNYLSIQSVSLATDPVQWLSYIDPDSLERLVQDKTAWEANAANEFGSDPGPPKFYSIVGTEIRYFPAPQQTYTCNFTIYERLDALADDSDTNWLLTTFPQVYLYGSALHSAPFLGADERLKMWGSLLDASIEKLMRSDPLPTNKMQLRSEVGVLTARSTRVLS